MSTQTGSEKDRVIIFDTTLRDGEQCPGATMTFEEKLEVAEMLDDMGVDVIEAGFPIPSDGDFPGCPGNRHADRRTPSSPASRASTRRTSTAARKPSKPARRGRIHTVIATSPLHMKVKLAMTPEQVIDALGHQRDARTQSNRRRGMVGGRRHP